MKFPFTHQLGLRDCGPACLKMISDFYGKNYTIEFLRESSHITKVGVSLLGISEAAEKIGFRSFGVKMDYDQLKEALESGPCIVHWQHNHFVVVYEISKRDTVYVADPGKGLVKYKKKEFIDQWIGEDWDDPIRQSQNPVNKANSAEGYALLLETTPEFYLEPVKEGLAEKVSLDRLWFYFKPYKRYFVQLILGMALSSIIMLFAPFLTQSMVDNGINMQNLNFVYLILAAQLIVFVGQTLVEVLRTWILLHIGTRMNLNMLSDFFQKLLKLPVSYFEKHITGDILQRIYDHKRIENLLTVSSLSTLFSFVNLVILSFVLIKYNVTIFFVFLVSGVLGVLWTWIFLKRRRNVDFKFFEVHSKESNKVLEILDGVQDIKISNSAKQKRWEWENLQAKLFTVKTRSLTIDQIQDIGSSFINKFSTIFISFIAAKAVIDGNLTLGSMFAINMVIGQMSGPLDQLINLISTVQDAKISFERINDVLKEKDEDEIGKVTVSPIPSKGNIIINNLSFTYGSDKLDPVLKNLNLTIPEGKITAIVGASGCGKTTLVKLLLRFYEPSSGSISLDGFNFVNLHHGEWREMCGAVLQDGKIFSGTIADNIAIGKDKNYEQIIEAAKIACIDEFITTLPMGYMTEIGSEGGNLSTGQKQRILLARAIYKKPSFLFLDEATSALDAKNEKNVMDNLNQFFKGRTVVIVAHRLSTVKNADQLIVMDQGEIVEIGNHLDLTKSKGVYYSLVKNQLELGD